MSCGSVLIMGIPNLPSPLMCLQIGWTTTLCLHIWGLKGQCGCQFIHLCANGGTISGSLCHTRDCERAQAVNGSSISRCKRFDLWKWASVTHGPILVEPCGWKKKKKTDKKEKLADSWEIIKLANTFKFKARLLCQLIKNTNLCFIFKNIKKLTENVATIKVVKWPWTNYVNQSSVQRNQIWS